MRIVGLGVALWPGSGTCQRRCFLFFTSSLLCLVFVCFSRSTATAATLAQTLPQPLVPYTLIQMDMDYENVTLALRRVDFWDGYVVLVGTATPRYGSVCLSRHDFALHIGNIQYEPADREKTRPRYGLDAPGTGVFIDCLTDREPEVLLLPFVVPVNQTPAVFAYKERLLALPASLDALRQASQAPPPTATPTATPTSTATATPTLTPIPTETVTPVVVATPDGAITTFSLPRSAQSRALFRAGSVRNQGLQFTLERIDFWDRLPDSTWPRNDLFIVFTGTLLPIENTASPHCVGAGEVGLRIGQQTYAMDNMRSANQFYQSAFPGYILPQCVFGNVPVTTFFIFDIDLERDETNENALLLLGGASLQLDLPLRALLATAVIGVDVPSLLPTAVLVPTVAANTVPETPIATFHARALVKRNANLRAGPSTSFAIIGSVLAYQAIEIIDSNPTQDWFQLVDGTWIAAFLVEDISLPPALLTPIPTEISP